MNEVSPLFKMKFHHYYLPWKRMLPTPTTTVYHVCDSALEFLHRDKTPYKFTFKAYNCVSKSEYSQFLQQ